jgi:hypothetical protein
MHLICGKDIHDQSRTFCFNHLWSHSFEASWLLGSLGEKRELSTKVKQRTNERKHLTTNDNKGEVLVNWWSDNSVTVEANYDTGEHLKSILRWNRAIKQRLINHSAQL